MSLGAGVESVYEFLKSTRRLTKSICWDINVTVYFCKQFAVFVRYWFESLPDVGQNLIHTIAGIGMELLKCLGQS